MKPSRLICLVATLGALAVPAAAHHSAAMFDKEKVLKVAGKVKEVQWTNPHVAIYVEEPGTNGAGPLLWLCELTSPGNLARLGWSKSSVKAGDKVTIEFNPLRNGKRGGWLKTITLADSGQTYTNDISAQESPNLK
jgi:Family of unknown function (DUF6152)